MSAPVPAVVENHLQISFVCDTACTDVTYTVQASSTLAAEDWTDIARSVGGVVMLPVGTLSQVTDSGEGQRTVTVTDSVPMIGGGRSFLRVKITLFDPPAAPEIKKPGCSWAKGRAGWFS